MKDWQIGAFLTYQSGFPIVAPVALNYPNPAQLLSLCEPQTFGCNTFAGFSSYATRVPGVPLFATDINSKWDPNATFILNPAAWANPPAGQFGTGSAYYNDYRARRVPSENLSLARIFSLKEGVNLQIRVELQNVFNRTQIPNAFNLAVFPQLTTNGVPTSGFGYSNAINTGGERTGQIVARLNF